MYPRPLKRSIRHDRGFVMTCVQRQPTARNLFAINVQRKITQVKMTKEVRICIHCNEEIFISNHRE
jgi:hypothetical protein